MSWQLRVYNYSCGGSRLPTPTVRWLRTLCKSRLKESSGLHRCLHISPYTHTCTITHLYLHINNYKESKYFKNVSVDRGWYLCLWRTLCDSKRIFEVTVSEFDGQINTPSIFYLLLWFWGLLTRYWISTS